MDREVLDPEIDVLLEELGAQLASATRPYLTITCEGMPPPDHILWWGQWWHRTPDGRYTVESESR